MCHLESVVSISRFSQLHIGQNGYKTDNQMDCWSSYPKVHRQICHIPSLLKSSPFSSRGFSVSLPPLCFPPLPLSSSLPLFLSLCATPSTFPITPSFPLCVRNAMCTCVSERNGLGNVHACNTYAELQVASNVVVLWCILCVQERMAILVKL